MDDPGFTLSAARVSIVGLGLMGASLAMDLRGCCARLIGVSRSPETLAYARQHNMVDQITDFESALDCELLILAAPVRTIVRQLEQISQTGMGGYAHPTVVLDLGSTKAEIVQAMEALPERYQPVGGHPMCGKEVAGIQHAEKGLYAGKTFVLTPLERTAPGGLALVQEMIAAIGSLPLILPAERQDCLVALTSHLPYLVASALMKLALASTDEKIWDLAASGFRDTTRLAASDQTMMIDILLTNRVAILKGLKEYRSDLDELARMIENADEAGLRTALAPAQQRRADLFKA